jgi:hypothetical protein
MSNEAAQCKWCSQRKQLIKAHIIPRKFFALVKKDESEKYTVLLRTSTAKRKTFLQAGIYDHSILCAECDGQFSQLDEYGWEVLGKPLSGNVITDPQSGVTLVTEVSAVDTDKLRRFLLSVLWRSSVSNLELYSNVNLGSKFEDDVKAKIFQADSLAYDEYSTCFVTIEELGVQGLENSIFPPYRARLDGLNWQVFYFPGLKVLIKVDSRPPGEVFQKLMVSKQDSFYLAKPTKGLVPEVDYLMRMRAEFARDTKSTFKK